MSETEFIPNSAPARSTLHGIRPDAIFAIPVAKIRIANRPGLAYSPPETAILIRNSAKTPFDLVSSHLHFVLRFPETLRVGFVKE